LLRESYDLQIGALRRRATFDESSVDANDHLVRQLIGFSIFGDLTLNLFLELIDPSAEEFRGVTSKGRIMQKASGSGGASLCPGAGCCADLIEKISSRN
jgi:hypothetical protein